MLVISLMSEDVKTLEEPRPRVLETGGGEIVSEKVSCMQSFDALFYTACEKTLALTGKVLILLLLSLFSNVKTHF